MGQVSWLLKQRELPGKSSRGSPAIPSSSSELPRKARDTKAMLITSN